MELDFPRCTRHQANWPSLAPNRHASEGIERNELVNWSRGQACQRIDRQQRRSKPAEDGKACVNRHICHQLGDKGSGWRESSRIWSPKGQRLHFERYAIIIFCPPYSQGTARRAVLDNARWSVNVLQKGGKASRFE